MNRIYTVTFLDPAPAIVTEFARSITGPSTPVQDVGGQSVSFRVTAATPDERDRIATLETEDVLAGLSDPWVLATGMGVHRRVVAEGGTR